MAATIKRTQCPKCAASGKDTSRNNLSWFYGTKGQLVSMCVAGCKNVEATFTEDFRLDSGSTDSSEIEQQALATSPGTGLIIDGTYSALQDRGISEATCRQCLYQVGTVYGKDAHIANYTDKNGDIISQKVRIVCDKSFTWRQNSNEKELFNRHQIGESRDQIFVTEGEIDCLSLFQLGYPTVSISTGAGSQAIGELQKHKEFLNSFTKVIICFDMDDVGQETAKELCRLLNPGKAWVVPFRHKDANEYLKIGAVAPLIEDLLAAQQYTPTAIRKPTLDDLRRAEPMGRQLPYPQLNAMIRGLKEGRLMMVLAGEKAGKSSFTKELIKSFVDQDPTLNVGLAYLEEPLQTTGQSFIAMDNNTPLYVLSENPDCISLENFKTSYTKYVQSDRVQYLDASFMTMTGPELISNLRFMIEVQTCKIIVLDHITMVTYDSTGENSERKDIDILMKNLRTLAHQTGASIITVCHLKQPYLGKSWSEGREIRMSDARGSSAFGQLCDVAIALERDQMSPTDSLKTKIKVLANRVTGKIGYVDEIIWNPETGRYSTLQEMFK